MSVRFVSVSININNAYMIIIAAIRKFLHLDNEIIAIDSELINSTGLMMEASKDFMPPYPSGGCFGLTDPFPTNHIHIGDLGNC